MCSRILLCICRIDEASFAKHQVLWKVLTAVTVVQCQNETTLMTISTVADLPITFINIRTGDGVRLGVCSRYSCSKQKAQSNSYKQETENRMLGDRLTGAPSFISLGACHPIAGRNRV